MGYLYALINKDNNKKFLGKSNLELKVLKKILYRALKQENHYNKLLQKEFKKYVFEFEVYESDDCAKDFDRIILYMVTMSLMICRIVKADIKKKRYLRKISVYYIYSMIMFSIGLIY